MENMSNTGGQRIAGSQEFVGSLEEARSGSLPPDLSGNACLLMPVRFPLPIGRKRR